MKKIVFVSALVLIAACVYFCKYYTKMNCAEGNFVATTTHANI